MATNRPVVLIAPVTGAVGSGAEAPFPVTQDRLPCTILADGLATTEEVQLSWSIDGGTTWVPLLQGGAAIVLTATINAVPITSPMLIGVTKDATAAACGVYVAVANKV